MLCRADKRNTLERMCARLSGGTLVFFFLYYKFWPTYEMPNYKHYTHTRALRVHGMSRIAELSRMHYDTTHTRVARKIGMRTRQTGRIDVYAC